MIAQPVGHPLLSGMRCSGPHWIGLQGIDLLKNHLESPFQLFLGSRLAFGPGKLTIVCDGVAIIVGCLPQQFHFLNVWCEHHSYFTLFSSLLQPRQLSGSVVFTLLNMVPNQLICHPGDLFSGQFNVLKSGIMANGEALTAFAADNGCHQDCGRWSLCGPA